MNENLFKRYMYYLAPISAGIGLTLVGLILLLIMAFV